MEDPRSYLYVFSVWLRGTDCVELYFVWPWFTLLLDCKNDKTSKIMVDLVDNSPFHLIGSFLGPEGTPYEGGHFQVVRPPSCFPFYHVVQVLT